MDRAKEHFAKSAFKFPKTEAMMNALVWPIAAGVGINMGTTAIMKATHSDDEPSVDRKRIESLVRTQVAKMVNQGGMP